jgi:hypothetical protein
MICVAALGAQAPAAAHHKTQDVAIADSAEQIQDRETNRAMLANLLQRRADAARSTGNAESRRSALEFLDRQIATVRGRLGQ